MDYQPYSNKRSTGFTTASLTLGTISLFSSCCLYLAIPCGALAIIFALLSRGDRQIMNSQAKLGLTLGGIGMTLTIVLVAISFLFIIATGGTKEFMNYYNNYYEQYMNL